ncbi:MAG: hypothetical protein LRY22_03610 [Aliarcobacter cryaerophilus]|nr:hypothetical protein [Aliarcobacter cryaerophilus]
MAIPIDDHTRHDFSQTAILAKHLKSAFIKPIFNTLKAKNIVKYAGKNLEFRQKNPRKFIYSGVKNCDVILVDDVITTGTTILEAKKSFKKRGCKCFVCSYSMLIFKLIKDIIYALKGFRC